MCDFFVHDQGSKSEPKIKSPVCPGPGPWAKFKSLVRPSPNRKLGLLVWSGPRKVRESPKKSGPGKKPKNPVWSGLVRKSPRIFGKKQSIL